MIGVGGRGGSRSALRMAVDTRCLPSFAPSSPAPRLLSPAGVDPSRKAPRTLRRDTAGSRAPAGLKQKRTGPGDAARLWPIRSANPLNFSTVAGRYQRGTLLRGAV